MTEPCYWTPSLPFLYELHAVAEVEGRRLAELQEGVGLRRIETRGGDLFWEGRRVTLRGGKIDDYANVDLAEARALEAGLLVVGPPADFCKQASMCGVPLVVDFRNCGAELSVELVSAARSPAVVAALVDADQVDSTVRFPADAIVAQAVCADGVSRLAPWADVVICEIAPTERPPDWLADCNRPVIAVSKIRDGSLPDARRRCDRLQARLAPEFDLAGYFA